VITVIDGGSDRENILYFTMLSMAKIRVGLHASAVDEWNINVQLW